MAGPSASQTIAELRIGLGLEAENLQPALSSFSQLLTKIERVTKSLRRQQEIADASGKAMSKGAQAATRASERQAAALRSQGNAVQSAFKATQMFNQAVNKVGAKQKETEILTKRMNKALLDYSKFMKVARSSNERFLATAKFKATMVRNTASLVDLKKSMLGGSTMAGKLQERFRDLTSSAVLVMGPLGGVAARLIQLKQALAFGVSTAAFVLGVAAATVVVTKLGIAAVRTGIEIDRLNNRLQIVTGSVALASAQFNDLVELADRSGANLSGLADQFTRMRQAVKGTSLEGDKFETIFEGLTMASAKFQLDADQTIGTLKAFEQMISKGTVQAEELRGQLGDRLPGALPIAAKALGKTTQELDKLLKAGAVATEDFLPKFVDMLKKVLGIKEGERINTVVAALGRLQNAWFLFSKEVSESFGIMNSVRAILDTAAAALTSLAQHMDKIAASVAAVGAAFTAWKLAALIGLISGAGGLIASLKVLHTWLMKIAKVQAVLTALTATMAGGYVKIIAALGAGIGTYVAVNKLLEGQGQAVASTSEEIREFIRLQQLLGGTDIKGLKLLLEGGEGVEGAKAKLKRLREEYEALFARFEKFEGTFFGRIFDAKGFFTPQIVELSKAIQQAELDTVALGDELAAMGDRIEDARQAKLLEDFKEIFKIVHKTNILEQKTAALRRGEGGGVKLVEEAVAQQIAIAKFAKEIEDLGDKMSDLNKNRAIENFKDRLIEFNQAVRDRQIEQAGKDVDFLKSKLELLSTGTFSQLEQAAQSFAMKQLESQEKIRKSVDKYKKQMEGLTKNQDELNDLTAEYERILRGISQAETFQKNREQITDILVQIGEVNRELEVLGKGPGALTRFQTLEAITKQIRDLKLTLKAGDTRIDILDRLEASLLRLSSARTLQPFNNMLHEMETQIGVIGETAALVDKLNLSFSDAEALAGHIARMKDLGIAMEDINKFTAAYLEKLERLNAATAKLEGMKLAIEGIEQAWSDAFDGIGDSLVDALAEGKNLLDSMADIAMELGKELVKLFLQLAVINPLKNAVLNPAVPFPTVTPGGFLGGGGGGALNTVGTIANPAWVRSADLIPGVTGAPAIPGLTPSQQGIVGGGIPIPGAIAGGGFDPRAFPRPSSMLNLTDPTIGTRRTDFMQGGTIGPAFQTPPMPGTTQFPHQQQNFLTGPKGDFGDFSQMFPGTEELNAFTESLTSATENLDVMTPAIQATTAAEQLAVPAKQATLAVEQGAAAAKGVEQAASAALAPVKTTEAAGDQAVAQAAFQAAAGLQAFNAANTTGLVGGLLAKGGAFRGGVQFAARGQVINSPTMFGSSQGPVIGGEAGPEAILPLKRGPDGKLGVSMPGGSGGGGAQHNTWNIYASDTRSVAKNRHQIAAAGFGMLRRGAKFT